MKYLKFLFPVTLCIGLLGCNSEPEQTQEIAVTTLSTQTAEPEIQFESSVPADAPTYQVGMSGKQPPFSFMNEFGNIQGIDVDIMRAVAENEGFHVEFHQEPFAEAFQTLDDGNNDILFGGVSYSDKRAEKYAVSDSYLFVPSAIMYNETKTTINDISNLDGLTYAGVPVTMQTQHFLDLYPNIKYVETDSSFLALKKLIQGEADFIAEDLQFLEYLALQYPDYDLAITTYQTADDPMSQQVALARKDDIELMAKINHAFEVLHSTGEIKRIESKWIDGQ